MYIKFKYLKIVSFCNGLVFYAPVALLLRTERGISISQFFILQAVLSFTILLFEVPTGIITDKIGYKKAIVISQSLLLIARILFLFANNFWYFLFEVIIEATANCFISGTSDAYLYAICDNKKFAKESSTIENYGTVGFIISTISYVLINRYFGLMGLIASTVAASAIALIFSVQLPKISSNTTIKKKAIVQPNFKNLITRDVIFLAIIGSVVTMGILIINFFYVIKLQMAGLSVELISPIILGYSLVQLSTPKIIDYFEHKKLADVLSFMLVVSSALFVLLYFANNLAGIILMLLIPTTLSITVFVQSQINNAYIDRIELNDNRASVISIINMSKHFVEVIFLLFSAIINNDVGNSLFLFTGILILIVSVIAKNFMPHLKTEVDLQNTTS